MKIENEAVRHYIELLEVFTFRELISRYKTSLLGPLWICIQPLLTAIILYTVFSTFIKIDTGTIPYFLFVLSGLVFWYFFQQSLELAKDSLIWNRDVVTKTAFKREILPLSYVISKIPDFFIFLLLIIILTALFGFELSFTIFFALLLIIPLFLFTAGIALVLTAINSVFKDFGRIVDFILMIIFYVTPIIYPPTLIPDRFYLLLHINPIAIFITLCRTALFEGTFDFELYLLSLAVCSVIFIAAVTFFRSFEKKLVDLI